MLLAEHKENKTMINQVQHFLLDGTGARKQHLLFKMSDPGLSCQLVFSCYGEILQPVTASDSRLLTIVFFPSTGED